MSRNCRLQDVGSELRRSVWPRELAARRGAAECGTPATRCAAFWCLASKRPHAEMRSHDCGLHAAPGCRIAAPSGIDPARLTRFGIATYGGVAQSPRVSPALACIPRRASEALLMAFETASTAALPSAPLRRIGRDTVIYGSAIV